MATEANESVLDPQELRRRAMERLQGRHGEVVGMPAADAAMLVHELEVYQVELEIQNEELRRAQLELAAALERYRDLYHRAPVGYLTLDAEGRVLQANQAAARLCFREREELEGQRLEKLATRKDRDRLWLLQQSAARTGLPQAGEFRIERPSGAPRWVHADILRLDNSQESPGGFRLTLTDVTARMQAEEALQEQREAALKLTEAAVEARTEAERISDELRGSEQNLRGIANIVPDLLWRSEPDGSTNWYNERWMEYTGQTFEQAIGWGWADAIHPDDREGSALRYHAAVEENRALQQERRIRRHDGEYRWFLARAMPLRDESGRVICMYGAATDIHEQRAALEALRGAHEELEAKVAERTRELSDANAELHAEVTERRWVEAARAELLQRLVTAQEDERRRVSRELHDTLGQYLTALHVGLQAIKGLDGCPANVAEGITKIRTLALKMDEEVERLSFELRPLALDDLGLEDALRRHVQEWAASSGVAVDLHAKNLDLQRLPAYIESTVYRVVQEALTNIRRHAAATRVSLIVERRRKELLAIIEDNGRGFDLEAVSGSAGGRRKFGLLGIRERAALVGGSLDVETEPGAGATLYLRLPLDYDQDNGGSTSHA